MPLKAFVIKILRISLNVRALNERSIRNSDTFEGICNQNIQNIAKCVRTLREQCTPNRNSDIYTVKILPYVDVESIIYLKFRFKEFYN